MEKNRIIAPTALFVIALGLVWYYCGSKSTDTLLANSPDVKQLETLLSLKGHVYEKDKVVKFVIPRTDLNVTVSGMKWHPLMGCMTWFSFQRALKKGVEWMVMGDFLVLEHQINPTLDKALQAGLQVTAIHKHAIFDKPHVYFIHVEGEGSARELCKAIKLMLAEATVVDHSMLSILSFVPTMPIKNAISPEHLRRFFSLPIIEQEGLCKMIIGREVQASCGCTVGENMGISFWATFGGTAEEAVVMGEIPFLETELQDGLKALRAAKFNIAEIHNHMVLENPRLIYVHFMGKDSLELLALGIKNMLAYTSMKNGI